MSLEEAGKNGANLCPRCFPTSEPGERFDVTELPGGVTRDERTDLMTTNHESLPENSPL